MSTTEVVPSRDTLDRAPVRALGFLIGVGRNPAIRGAMETRGYSTAEHNHGWHLLRSLDPAATPAGGAATRAQSDPAVRTAIAALDAWDNDNLPIADVALVKREPAAHAWLFANGLAPADGWASVPVVAIFLDRIDSLEARAEKEKTGKKVRVADGVTLAQAKAAMGILASRGITAEIRVTARAWIATVQKGATPAAPASPKVSDEPTTAASDLHDWISEWTLVARKVLKRRDHLIAIGIGEKKAARRGAKPGVGGDTPAG